MVLGRKHWLLPLVALTTCTLIQVEGIEKGQEEPRFVVKRNAHRHRGRFSRNRFQELRRLSNNSHWPMFAPQTPSPDQINCYIEVEVTQLFGGRCVRLGGEFQRAVCQSGIHLDFWNNECNSILAERESSQSDTSSGARMSTSNEGQQDGGQPVQQAGDAPSSN